MKAIILAGGYAKRLWPLTKDTPKQLLEVDEKPVIEYLLDKITNIHIIDQIIISTNKKFEEKFKNYIDKHKIDKKIKLIIEPSDCEACKLGSVGGLKWILQNEKIADEVLVIAGDNIFESDLIDFIKFYKKNRTACVITDDIKNKKLAKNYGICEISKTGKITKLTEKPSNPKTTIISTGCYILPKRDLKFIDEYLADGNDFDAMGHFIAWLVQKKHVLSFDLKGKWFDIGSKEELEKAEEFFEK